MLKREVFAVADIYVPVKRRGKRLIEVRDDVVDMLDADRKHRVAFFAPILARARASPTQRRAPRRPSSIRLWPASPPPQRVPDVMARQSHRHARLPQPGGSDAAIPDNGDEGLPQRSTSERYDEANARRHWRRRDQSHRTVLCVAEADPRSNPGCRRPADGQGSTVGCAGCHGDHGVSSNPTTQSLAGQDAEYLVAALRVYKSGARADETMKT